MGSGLDEGKFYLAQLSVCARLVEQHLGQERERGTASHEQQRPDVLQRRRAWFEAQPGLDPDRLVFASTKMARAQAGLRGWKTTTFVGALRLSGMTAPMVLDGAMHGAAFLAYVKKVLVPTLEPGDIVVMDNLAAHRPVREAIHRVGAELSLQPRSQPIEMAFSKFKADLKRDRRTLGGPRTDIFTPADELLPAAGYDRV